jgi:hypothetical protein
MNTEEEIVTPEVTTEVEVEGGEEVEVDTDTVDAPETTEETAE